MTRDEALCKMPPWRLYGEDGSRAWLLDNLVALGVVQIDAVSSTDKRLATALARTFSFDTDPAEMKLFRTNLAACNLAIIEENKK